MDGFEVFDFAVLEVEILFDVLELKKLLSVLVVDFLGEGLLLNKRGLLRRSFFLGTLLVLLCSSCKSAC